MYIKDIRTLEGPNIYSSKPVIKMILDVGELENVATREIPGFNEAIIAYLPGLAEHHCCLGRPGGFLIRLREGTYFPHVIEHVALEILKLSGQEVSFGKARQIRETLYDVIFEYREKQAASSAARLSVEFVKSILTGEPLDLTEKLSQLSTQTLEERLGPSTLALVEEAARRGIPVTRVGGESFAILGYGKDQRRIRAAMTQATSCIAVELASDKSLTKDMLAMAGVPVPRGTVVTTREGAIAGAQRMGYPVVAKPRDANQGKGVSLDLMSEAEVVKAFDLARAYSPDVLVEEYIQGKHYRVLVVGGKFLCAAQRIPANVTGDGASSIRELVDLANRDQCRGENHEKPLTKIKIDAVALEVLARQGYDSDAVVPPGVQVFLRENCNLSTGGEAVDVTREVCPENRRLSERVANIIGLDIAGIDIATRDISIPIETSGGAVIEVNAAPGLRMHLYPSRGDAQPVANAIVDLLFPGGPPAFPLVAVTGTNGKTTTVRMLGKILTAAGYRVGMTSTDGVYIGGELIKKGDCSGPESAKIVLFDPTVEAAVLEIARGGLIRGGLAYNNADVGIITNITSDHLGLDGVSDLEDLAFVKSLVAERVKPGGCSVLNADDPMSMQVLDRASGRVILFSAEADNLMMRKHLSLGDLGVYVKNDNIYVEEKGEVRSLAKVKDLPATLKGKAKHNLHNALAAIAGAWGIGVPLKVIAKALKEFACDGADNPGRMNLMEMQGIRVLVDYGHNAGSFEAIIATAKRLKPGQLVGVIGSPSDRRDQDIVALGAIAARGFQRLIIKEDEDLRGRKPGETAALLLTGALGAGLKREKIDVILKEDEAVVKALGTATAGDLVVVFYENYEKVMKVLLDIREVGRVPEVSFAPLGIVEI